MEIKNKFKVKFFENILAIFLFVALISLGLAMLAPYILFIQSTKANINGKLIYIRAPIPGELILNDYQSGQSVSRKERIGSINNPRTDSLILKREEVESQLSKSQRELESLREQLKNYQNLIEQIDIQTAILKRKLSQQQRLDNKKTDFEIKRLKRRVNQADAEFKIKLEGKISAQKEAQRFEKLAEQGAIAFNNYEKLQSIANQSKKEADKAYEEYQQTVVELDASKYRLSSEQINYLARIEDTEGQQQQLIIHKQQVLTQKINFEQQISSIEAEIQSLKNELIQIKKQIQVSAFASIQSPIDGAIWSVIAQPHEYMEVNSPILAIVDCKKRWVEALFSEDNVAQIHPKSPVKIKLLDSNKKILQGRIEAIRAGIGRISPGEDVAINKKELPKRQVALQISVEWPQDSNYQEYCYVGRSVEVIIPRFSNGKI
ncbi:HlyD family efflux transporter periplasmic adaptor subunit [Nostoc sp. UHCC 0302]|uniref:HlyD family secretion protein n=1 Tax=Nostoc sp. UHCC 0302 TaxID=3134896 RepID=UPI00311CC39C